ncbi:hypothetical protein [Endozoicomonas sp.]|uniref:hypothetical protein n=1 Tax=Endozoicomonas sp. TaxID=1892382 RepID=UPI00383AB692
MISAIKPTIVNREQLQQNIQTLQECSKNNQRYTITAITLNGQSVAVVQKAKTFLDSMCSIWGSSAEAKRLFVHDVKTAMSESNELRNTIYGTAADIPWLPDVLHGSESTTFTDLFDKAKLVQYETADTHWGLLSPNFDVLDIDQNKSYQFTNNEHTRIDRRCVDRHLLSITNALCANATHPTEIALILDDKKLVQGTLLCIGNDDCLNVADHSDLNNRIEKGLNEREEFWFLAKPYVGNKCLASLNAVAGLSYICP